jgi:hypothetical protein
MAALWVVIALGYLILYAFATLETPEWQASAFALRRIAS